MCPQRTLGSLGRGCNAKYLFCTSSAVLPHILGMLVNLEDERRRNAENKTAGQKTKNKEMVRIKKILEKKRNWHKRSRSKEETVKNMEGDMVDLAAFQSIC
jgi:hypothetical protein